MNRKLHNMTLEGGDLLRMPDSRRLETVEFAAESIGRTDWSVSGERKGFKKGTNKCNLYASEAVEDGGNNYPQRYRYGFPRGPVPAGDSGDPKKSLPYMRIMPSGSALPGDVVAWKRDYADATGHVMIFMGNVGVIARDGTRYKPGQGGAIGAGSSTVNYRSMSWLSQHGYGGDAVYRRSTPHASTGRR